MTRLFPYTLIVLNVCAALVCAWHGEYRRATYWTAAAVLNWTVTA